jgi:hypothetical protein
VSGGGEKVVPEQEKVSLPIDSVCIEALRVTDLDFNYFVGGHYVSEGQLHDMTEAQRKKLAELLGVGVERINKGISEV